MPHIFHLLSHKLALSQVSQKISHLHKGRDSLRTLCGFLGLGNQLDTTLHTGFSFSHKFSMQFCSPAHNPSYSGTQLVEILQEHLA